MNTGIETTRQTDPIGNYVFDFVQPGTYSVSVEMAGFSKFTKENIVVLTRGDVTVNAPLQVGGVAETITVSEAVASLQFNTSTMSTTVVGTMLKELPVLARNPFTLALLDPAVVNQYWDVSHRNPFYMHSSNGLDVGGSTGGKNDLLLDGVTLDVGARGSYAPSMDSVQEVAVLQNAVDAEFGFSAGGVFSLSMKSGTNDFHGTGYYFGRNPKFNALSNSIYRTPNTVRNHVWGGTVGGPIKKNRLFFFQAWEQWRNNQPSGTTNTVPTDLERTGDFSQTKDINGGLRAIYDPFTTKFDSATGVVTRTPFAGNIIPRDRMDPTGVKVIADLWKPNNPGNNPTGVNNFKTGYPWWLHYWNFSNRVDYNISDKLRMYARFSKFETRLDNPNWGGTAGVRSDNGGLMDALNAAADVLYQFSPTTVLNIRFGTTYVEDDYDSAWAQVGEKKWADLWPNGWYKKVLAPLPGIYYPSMNFSGNGGASVGMTGWWLYRPRMHNYQVNLSKDNGKHHMKFGQTLRYQYERSSLPNPGSWSFSYVDTASTFIQPDPKMSGDPYASLLLGVMNGGYARIERSYDIHNNQWGFYFQDDIKLTRNLTLNAGLRYEYETAPWEETDQYSRYLDLNQPIQELQGVQMPADVGAIAQVPYKYNGAWIFTDSNHRRLYKEQHNIFLPRIGFAYRLNDKTALRAGFARYAIPMINARSFGWNTPIYGFQQQTNLLPNLEGKPGSILSDPYPAGVNPIKEPVGKGFGRYTNLGDNASWFQQNLRTPINDRYNVSIQRQLPGNYIFDGTFFMNLGRNIVPANMWGSSGYQRAVNMMDPSLVYQYKSEVDKAVPNPFYGLLPADKMPGGLRDQQTVSIRQLLRPYPQYQNLDEMFMNGFNNHYYAMQLKLARQFGGMYSLSVGYNYNQESTSSWFNDIDQYANRMQMFDNGNPRHRLSMAGTLELPFGKGRKHLAGMHPVLNAIVGGWTTSHILFWNGGNLLYFDQMKGTGSPTINKQGQNWFTTANLAIPDPYTPRTNPWFYDGVRGPRFWSFDSTLAKYFPITERVRLELRLEAYNTLNHFITTAPDTSVSSGNFGQAYLDQANYGREVQYTARIHF